MSKSRRKDVDANRDTRDSDSQFDSGAAPDFCFPIKARKTPFEDIEQGAITFAMANARGTLKYDEYVCDMRVLEHVESAVSKRQKQIASSLQHYKTRKLVVLLAYRIGVADSQAFEVAVAGASHQLAQKREETGFGVGVSGELVITLACSIDPVWTRNCLAKSVDLIHTGKVRDKPQEARREIAEAIQSPLRPELLSVLQHFNEEVESFQRGKKQELQLFLDELDRKPIAFASADEKKIFASLLMQLLNRLSLRLVCQYPGCHQPSILRGGRYGNAKHGIFQFQHVVDGRRTSHVASPTLPRLELVGMPERKSRKYRI